MWTEHETYSGLYLAHDFEWSWTGIFKVTWQNTDSLRRHRAALERWACSCCVLDKLGEGDKGDGDGDGDEDGVKLTSLRMRDHMTHIRSLRPEDTRSVHYLLNLCIPTDLKSTPCLCHKYELLYPCLSLDKIHNTLAVVVMVAKAVVVVEVSCVLAAVAMVGVMVVLVVTVADEFQ